MRRASSHGEQNSKIKHGVLRRLLNRASRHIAAVNRETLPIESLESRVLLTGFGPVGSEFRVNTTTVGRQDKPAIAQSSNGNSVIVWQSALSQSDWDIFAQRLDAAGNPLGAEFRVNSTNADFQSAPTVATDQTGNFVIAWTSLFRNGATGIYAQRYDALGVPLASEFRVNSLSTTQYQKGAAIAMDSQGDFVVAWRGYGQGSSSGDIYARRFDKTGNALANEFRVNTNSSGKQDFPSASMSSGGNFVITWERAEPGPTVSGLYAQLYDSAGTSLGSELRVGIVTSDDQGESDVAMDATGNFVIAWYNSAPPGFSGASVHRYDAQGTSLGPDIHVNNIPGGARLAPKVAMSANGDFVVAGIDGSLPPNSPSEVFAQGFTAAGVPDGTAFQVNTYALSAQTQPDVAHDSNGHFTIVWTSYGQDGSDNGVYAQRYRPAIDALSQAAVGGSVFSDIDGNGVRDAGEPGIDGATVSLLGDFDSRVGSIVTANGGFYRFDHINSGNSYHLTFAVPTGYLTKADQGTDDAVDSDADPATGRTAAFSIQTNQVDLTRDAGVVLPTFANGVVWIDANANGIRDGGESGIDGVAVQLFTASGNLADSTLTSGGGLYQFDSLRVGDSYYLQIAAQSGLLFTLQDQGSDDAVDSDVDRGTGRTSVFSVVASQGHFIHAAGLIPAASISGVQFEDTNGNGLRDPGENGLAGWIVYIDANGNGQPDTGEAMSITDLSGGYSFAGLFPGAYHLANVARISWQATTPPAGFNVTLSPGQELSNVNLGVQKLSKTFVTAPGGTEFRVNTTTAGRQLAPAIATGPDGRSVVVWVDQPTPSRPTIRFQRYDAAGAPIGSEQAVISALNPFLQSPAVAISPSGDFVVTWNLNSDIYARRYTAAGAPLGSEFLVNSIVSGVQAEPSIAMDALGDFVIAWQDTAVDGSLNGVVAARFDKFGNRVGGQFQVNTGATNDQTLPAVAMDAGGDAVIAWQSNLQDGSGWGIYAQRYDFMGGKAGGEFRVNTTTLSNQTAPSVAMGAAGDFVITWTSENQDAQGLGVYAQRFDASGIAVGLEFRVNTFITGNQASPAVAVGPEGDFVITWSSNQQDGSNYGVYAQRYTASGAPQGIEFRVNTFTTGQQFLAVVASNYNGDFTIVWVSVNQDGSQEGVYGQRYQAFSDPASVGGLVWNDLNGDGVREPGEAGRDGVVATIFSAAGLAIATSTTVGGGLYQFAPLVPNQSYYIQFTSPASTTFTLQDRALNDLFDSDADPFTGRTSIFALGPNEVGHSQDAGLVAPSSISGTLFNDVNGDGVRQPGESGLPAWQVFLDINGNGQLDSGEPAKTSDSSGSYSFTGLPPGLYRLSEILPNGWTLSTPAASLLINLPAGYDRKGADIGSQTQGAGPVALRGFVWNDADGDGLHDFGETGRDGVALALFDDTNTRIATQTTSAAGFYRFDNLQPGRSYYVLFTPPSGLVFTFQHAGTDPRADSDVDPFANRTALFTPAINQVDLIQDAGLVPAANISGINFNDLNNDGFRDASEAGLSRWTIYIDRNSNGQLDSGEPSTVTDSTGAYALTGLSPGDYHLAALPQKHWTQSTQMWNTVTLLAGQKLIGWDVGVHTDVPFLYSVPAGPELVVNTTTGGAPLNPAIARNASGDFVIVWNGDNGSAQTFLGQLFNADGTKKGSEFLIGQTSSVSPLPPSVAMDAVGNFVVAWSKRDPGSPYQVNARRFDSTGAPSP
jgi:hypothetical protein